ncbi:hypothetical protein ABFV05_015564 [Capra hircus]
MGTIKDRNGMDLTEAEDIKKRWQEYTEELYKKDLHDQDNHDDMITHLEPDILECEVKWALESITINKASGDGMLQILILRILGTALYFEVLKLYSLDVSFGGINNWPLGYYREPQARLKTIPVIWLHGTLAANAGKLDLFAHICAITNSRSLGIMMRPQRFLMIMDVTDISGYNLKMLLNILLYTGQVSQQRIPSPKGQ